MCFGGQPGLLARAVHGLFLAIRRARGSQATSDTTQKQIHARPFVQWLQSLSTHYLETRMIIQAFFNLQHALKEVLSDCAVGQRLSDTKAIQPKSTQSYGTMFFLPGPGGGEGAEHFP